MNAKRTYLGLARTYRLPNGELAVEEDSLRRPAPRRAHREDLGDDGFGDDDFGDDVGDDDLGDDDLGDDDIGALSREERQAIRKRRKGIRKGGRAARKDLREDRRRERRDDDDDVGTTPGGNVSKKQHKGWVNTVLSGSKTLGAAGADAITIIPNTDFKSGDIAFTGLSGSTVTGVFFGDTVAFNNAVGTDIAFFAPGSQFRQLIEGQTIRAGVPITINVVLPGAGTVAVAIAGQKPASC